RGAGARHTGGRAPGRDRPPPRHGRHRRRRGPRDGRAWLAYEGRRGAGSTGHRRKSLADDVARARRAAAARPPWHPHPACRIPHPAGVGGWAGEGLRAPVAGRRGGAPARVPARSRSRSDVRREGLRLSLTTCGVRGATSRILAYVCGPVTPFGTVELTVYPYECDAYGHLNQAALLTLLERARRDALARGPGMDLFDRNGVWPAVRKATIEYRAPAFARDLLRVETTVAGRGTTSMTLRHVVRRVSDDATVAEADIVFVCIDGLGRATPIPEEIARFLGPR